MDGLLQLCEDEGIDVQFLPLTRSLNILGWYYLTRDGEPVIALEEGLQKDRRECRVVLAEEYAHHVTTPVGTLAPTYIVHPSQNRVNRWRDESRAVRAAADLLIPTSELREVLSKELAPVDARRVADLADHFFVTEWLVQRKLDFLFAALWKREPRVVTTRDLRAMLAHEAWWDVLRVDGLRLERRRNVSFGHPVAASLAAAWS